LKNDVTASTVLGTAANSGELQNAYDYADQSGVTTSVTENAKKDTKENTIENTMATPEKIIKKFEVATTLSNSVDNITKEELKTFLKLDKKVNKNDVLYNEFEQNIVKNLQKMSTDKTYADKGMQNPIEDIPVNVGELLRNYSE
jgi:hypothetical protein